MDRQPGGASPKSGSQGAAQGRVILARPHDFIVGAMREFVSRNGFLPVVPSTVAELQAALELPAVGVVISTAATSIIPRTFAEVYGAVRRALPRTPVAVASLSRIESCQLIVRTELPAPDGTLPVLPSEEASLADPRLGTRDVMIFLNPTALAPAASGLTLADRLLRAHFRSR